MRDNGFGHNSYSYSPNTASLYTTNILYSILHIYSTHSHSLYLRTVVLSTAAPGQRNTKLPPLGPPINRQHLLSNRLLDTLAVPFSKLALDQLQMLRLPMQPHQARDEQLRAFAARARFPERLVQQHGVAHRPVDHAVEDVR